MAEPSTDIYLIIYGEISNTYLFGGIFTTLELAQDAATRGLADRDEQEFYNIYKVPLNRMVDIHKHYGRDEDCFIQTIRGKPYTYAYMVTYHDGNHHFSRLDRFRTLEQAKQYALAHMQKMSLNISDPNNIYPDHKCTIEKQHKIIWTTND